LTYGPDGSVWTWGFNSVGQLGVGDATGPESCAGSPCSTLPVRGVDPTDPSGFLPAVRTLSASSGHVLAVKNDGTVRAWGSNESGQLGDGSTTTRFAPVQVRDGAGPLTNVIEVAGGNNHSLALLADGTVRGWGLCDTGQIGDGVRTAVTTPVKVRF
jgi:alpha-tubulin suppressor-like RCC1 family protein